MGQEFLPLCDVLFNIISLAAYFCDVVFDIILVYTLYLEKKYTWFLISLTFCLISLLISQIMSLKWHLFKKHYKDIKLYFILTLHMLQLGILWRYFKLFIPVELSNVKHEVRDLCMLRLVHAFCEAAPMLLIQLYLTWLQPSAAHISDLSVVSALLSLFNVCWALASFSKNVRRRNIHRLVLTWLGVICQFFWRLGTVTSRAVALTVYATLYQQWVFIVIALHWLSMLLWLISPKNVFHGEAMSWHKRIGFSMLIAFAYIFCYINLQEYSARSKMIMFYATMFLENMLLMSVWLALKTEVKWFHNAAIGLIVGGFIIGICFMFLYYKVFHIRLLKHNFLPTDKNYYSNSPIKFYEKNYYPNNLDREYAKNELTVTNLPLSIYKSKTSAMFPGSSSYSNCVSNVPGVFNCRLNPALKRKKKKPSSFVPLPKTLHTNGKTPNPFWKRLPLGPCSSDHESSVGSRVNIQQKLQEKKKQQLQELKEIQEEIKLGKLKPPKLLEMSEQGTLRQPIPQSKKRPWLSPHYQALDFSRLKLRSQTPEILLAPESFESNCVYYDYPESRLYSMVPSMNNNGSEHSSISDASRSNMKREHDIHKSYRTPSDLESQISLPRSFTLPREFKYQRKVRSRKPIRTDYFIASTNSSDGDVDSADDGDPMSCQLRYKPYTYRTTSQLHETKL